MKQVNWKRIVVHIPVWLVLLMLINSDLLDLEWGPYKHSEGTLLFPSVVGMVVNAVIFYLNAYYLIPHFLKKKKLTAYWIKTITIVVAFTLVEVGFDIIYLIRAGVISYADFQKVEMIPDVGVLGVSTLIFNTFYWGIAFLYRLPSDWMQNERIKNQLTRDKLSAELEFLKAQINPHFLFNGINSIYHLIGFDDQSARDVLLRFSGLLRYQLYECKEEFISLPKELEYLANYIKLEEIRKGEDACFVIDMPQDEQQSHRELKVAPLLFTPFLENAFKYLSHYTDKEENKFFLNINIANGVLDFVVENSVNLEMVKRQSGEKGGIGLENVKRRLKLLYPDRHKLTIQNEENKFHVHLKLDLV